MFSTVVRKILPIGLTSFLLLSTLAVKAEEEQSAVCLEAKRTSRLYQYPNALVPNPLGWMTKGSVAELKGLYFDPKTGTATYYLITGGWVISSDVKKTSCD
ncbi:MAG: hypothetical protein F6K50_06340 [Moorea sp. SIO3I7]|nr:hypothetical protein [Moorena sp. SIO3I7]